MTRYLIKRTTTYNGNTRTYYVGKQDMEFDTLNDAYLVLNYGFRTIPAAKRDGAWRNRFYTRFIYTINDTRIVRIDFTDFGSIKSIAEEEA